MVSTSMARQQNDFQGNNKADVLKCYKIELMHRIYMKQQNQSRKYFDNINKKINEGRNERRK